MEGSTWLSITVSSERLLSCCHGASALGDAPLESRSAASQCAIGLIAVRSRQIRIAHEIHTNAPICVAVALGTYLEFLISIKRDGDHISIRRIV